MVIDVQDVIVGVVLPLNRVKVELVPIFGETVVACRYNTNGFFFHVVAYIEFFVSVKVLDHAEIRAVDIFGQLNCEVHLFSSCDLI